MRTAYKLHVRKLSSPRAAILPHYATYNRGRSWMQAVFQPSWNRMPMTVRKEGKRGSTSRKELAAFVGASRFPRRKQNKKRKSTMCLHRRGVHPALPSKLAQQKIKANDIDDKSAAPCRLVWLVHRRLPAATSPFTSRLLPQKCCEQLTAIAALGSLQSRAQLDGSRVSPVVEQNTMVKKKRKEDQHQSQSSSTPTTAPRKIRIPLRRNEIA